MRHPAVQGREDDESQAWLRALRGPRPVREAAVAELHSLLLRAALDDHVDTGGGS